jgi:hypothetical protein
MTLPLNNHIGDITWNFGSHEILFSKIFETHLFYRFLVMFWCYAKLTKINKNTLKISLWLCVEVVDN